jgi:hypothetical protein
MSRYAIRRAREHQRALAKERPDIDWDKVREEYEKHFGPLRFLPKKKKSPKTAVYLMSATDFGPTKVGVAIDVEKRLSQIQTGHPFPLRLSYVIWFSEPQSAFDAEKWLLQEVDQELRLNGEWINSPAAKLTEMLRNFARRHLASSIIETIGGEDAQ